MNISVPSNCFKLNYIVSTPAFRSIQSQTKSLLQFSICMPFLLILTVLSIFKTN